MKAPRNGRLDVLLSEVYDLSRSRTAKLIADGNAAVDGKAVTKPAWPVCEGQELLLTVPQPTELPLEKEDIPLTILYQDEDIAVVDKPSGLVTHPAAGNETGTLVQALLFHLDHLSGIGGVKRPGIVHRLDKDTSGLLMVAKNDAAHQALSDMLKSRAMEKHYLAVVEGQMKESAGRIDVPIARSRTDRKKMAIDAAGREAHTEWTLLETLKGASLLDVHILTGRTHQIRVHMQSVHHPVAGDPIYGLKKGVNVSRLMLHAYSLRLPHPRSGKDIFITCEPPQPFLSSLSALRNAPGEPFPWKR